MKTIKYDVNYFINKFSAIPEDRWTTHTRMDPTGRRCAHGHCHIGNPHGVDNKEEKALSELAKENYDITTTCGFAFINNGLNPRYKQSTPKGRVLAALHDIKAKHSPIKEKIVYVTVDKEIRKLQKEELILN